MIFLLYGNQYDKLYDLLIIKHFGILIYDYLF